MSQEWLQSCHRGVAEGLQECYRGVVGLLQKVARVFQECHRVSQERHTGVRGVFQTAAAVFQGCSRGVTGVLQRCHVTMGCCP
jgi:hypothetical protein